MIDLPGQFYDSFEADKNHEVAARKFSFSPTPSWTKSKTSKYLARREHTVTNTINRDAGDKSKGPRLQRFRALELLFNAHQMEHVSHVYVATECEADVSIHLASKSDSSTFLEENKNYDEATAFTFASKQILNTMVSFLDVTVHQNQFALAG